MTYLCGICGGGGDTNAAVRGIVSNAIGAHTARIIIQYSCLGVVSKVYNQVIQINIPSFARW